MATTLSLAPLFRQSVGFDRFNDLFESALRSGLRIPIHLTTWKSTVTTRTALSSPSLA